MINLAFIHILNNSIFSNDLDFHFLNKNKGNDNLNEDADSSKAVLNVNDGEGLKASFLDCFHSNLTSLNNKMFELQAYMEFDDFPCFIFITDTWFKPETADKPGLMVKLIVMSCTYGIGQIERDEILLLTCGQTLFRQKIRVGN